MKSLIDLGAVEAGRMIAAGDISSEALTRACLERIDARNPAVKAFNHYSAELALAAARAADQQTPASPLHGVPFAVKDVIDTKDFPTGYGTVIHQGRQPAANAAAVDRLLNAGAVLVGKVVTTEYAMFTPNETRHPLNPAHTPGGSSSGTAAAVADRMVPIALGNQTAGSLIRPAAYCGVFGLKPTHGTTDGRGILPLQPFFDTLGYMARTVEDLAAGYGIVLGADPDPQWSVPRPLRIGLCQTPQWEHAGPAARKALMQSGEQLARQGIDVNAFELPADFADLVACHRRILYTGIAHSLGPDYDRAGHQMSAGLRSIIEEGRATTSDAYDQALAFAGQCRERINDVIGDLDALVTPSAPGEAPIGTATGSPIFQVAWTLLGVPAINLPVAVGPRRLPLGIQLIGKRHDDAELLRLAEQLMRDFPLLNITED